MSATVTASIASLILTIPVETAYDTYEEGNPVGSQVIQDVATVRVWASTTSGFTPSDSNLVYTGKCLTVVIANLTPLTTYYLKYALISEIDPTNIEYSSELSGTPNKIDGSIIVDGSITSNQISATAIRGKSLSGNVLMDAGSIVTSNTIAPTTVTGTCTINLYDTLDFPSSGAFIHIPSQIPYSGIWVKLFRYTGKTSTSLTGCSGISNVSVFAKGDIIIPVSASMVGIIDAYDGSGTLYVDHYCFRTAAGTKNAISIALDGNNLPADFFTYTGAGTTQPTITGVAGLATWTAESDAPRVIFDNPGYPTVTIASTGNYSSLTTSVSNSTFLNQNGGIIALASTTKSYIQIVYTSYSGTTITLPEPLSLDANTYTLLPLQNYSIVGAADSIFTFSNVFDWYGWAASSSTINKFGIFTEGSLQADKGGVFSSIQYSPITANGAGLAIGTEPRSNIDIPTSGWTPYDGSIGANYFRTLGMVWGDSAPLLPPSGDNAYIAWVDHDNDVTPIIRYFQPISNRLLFSDTGDEDSITFEDATNVYSFNADSGSGNASIFAYRLGLGSASVSSSSNIYITDAFTINATRYGIYNNITFSNATLTADRLSRAAYNVASTDYQNSAAFTLSLYGSYSIAQTTTTSGNSVNGEGALYGAYNYALHQSDELIFNRMENAYGSYNRTGSTGNTSLIDQAYGSYNYIQTSGTSSTASVAITTAYAVYGYVNAGSTNRNITTAYLLYLTSAETGTVTTKWGVYVNSTWPNFFNGNVIMDGAIHYTPTVITPVAAGTTTLTTSTSMVLCNHTATIASHTFTFPSTSLTNGQTITISARSAITTVTLSGGTFYGGITTLAAGATATFTYSSTATAWFRT